MVHFPRWKVLLIVGICLLGVVYAAPNLFSRDATSQLAQSVPGWLPVKQVNLGLDLQGGSHLLLRVEYEAVLQERLESLVDSLRAELRRERVGYTGLGVADGAAQFTIRDPADLDIAQTAAEAVADGGPASAQGGFFGGLGPVGDPIEVLAGDDGTIRLIYSEQEVTNLRDTAVAQSIEIVRRRIDELGTNEPNIQRQGADRIVVQLPGVDDPERIKSLLGQTARLTFHLIDTATPLNEALAGRIPPGSELVPSNELDAAGEPITQYVVRRRVMVSGDSLTNAQPTFQDGRAVVSFSFDTAGARRFGDVTRDNVGNVLAIVLDGQVVSAPVIRSPILGGQGIIEGGFTVETANDLALLLRAGALPAPLTVLEERTVGPGLGADSIAAGEIAALVGFVLVVVFMGLSYGRFGLMADVALVVNLILILALLSLLQATLTLPGIAGIVLTVGMAVDANVLIFERIREEVRNGRSPISAIDAGYSRAMTTIIDSNLTTLIAAILLFLFGSGPVRGFSVTLAIGIICSMFTAVMVTRMLVVLWLRRTKPKTLAL